MKEYLGVLGGVVAVSVLLHYALRVVQGKAEADSLATWFMWTMTDALLLITTWQTGKPVWLPLAWTIGSGLVTFSLIRRGEWFWSDTETVSAICTSIAIIIWLTQGAAIGVIAGTVALMCAGVPLMIDMIRNPIRSTFHVWFLSAISCVLTILGSDMTFQATFLPCGSLIYNVALSLLVLRSK